LLSITRATPSIFDPQIAADNPSCFLQSLVKCRHTGLYLGIVRSDTRKHADATHFLTLLRARRERPACRRATDQRDELATLHSITSLVSMDVEPFVLQQSGWPGQSDFTTARCHNPAFPRKSRCRCGLAALGTQ
jgi:hypothetical protein